MEKLYEIFTFRCKGIDGNGLPGVHWVCAPFFSEILSEDLARHNSRLCRSSITEGNFGCRWRSSLSLSRRLVVVRCLIT